MRLRPGLELLEEDVGAGDKVSRRGYYFIRLRVWLNQGDPVRWASAWGQGPWRPTLEDNGETLLTTLRVDRNQMFNGLFYGVQGMRVGGRRKLHVAPQLGYGEAGIPGMIPPKAALTVEVWVLDGHPPNQPLQETGSVGD